MTDQSMTDPLEPTPAVATEPVAPKRRNVSRGKRVLAVVAGVAMVPALYAAASAVTGGGERPSVSAAAGSDDTVAGTPGTEVEVEHGVTTVKPDDDGTETTTPPTQVTTEPPTEDTTPPTDDTTPPPATEAPAATPQTFTSTGGSITVTLEDGALTLNSVDEADGWTPQVHDERSDRVEVRFFDADGKEWRIRIEVEGSGLTQEITFHG